MKKIFVLFAAAVLATSCLGLFNYKIVRGDGIPDDKTFEVGQFDGITVSGAMDVIYNQAPGDAYAVLHTDQNLLDSYEIVVINNVMHISNWEGVNPVPTVDTYLTCVSEKLESVKVSGSGSCIIDNGIEQGGDFYFVVSGSGSLKANSMECKDFISKISGSGNININTLTADNVSVEITGSGNANIVLVDAGDIDVRITGSGNVSLSGNARHLNTKITGSGNIDTRRLALSGN